MQTQIPEKELTVENTSFADNVGQLFYWKGNVFRGIHSDAETETQRLLSSGLIDHLIKEGHFPKTEIASYSNPRFSLIVEHEKVSPVVFPFEWTYTQLQDAALCVLRVNEIASTYGYELKDCHPFNVLFKNGKPVYLDLGSFQRTQDPTRWTAHSEFLRTFVYILEVWREIGETTARKLLLDGSMLSHGEYLRIRHPMLRLLDRRRLDRFFERSYRLRAMNLENLTKRAPNWAKRPAQVLADKKWFPFTRTDYAELRKRIAKLSKRTDDVTRWGNYHTEYFSSDASDVKGTPRFQFVLGLLKKHKIKTLVEIGGNAGVFSLLALKQAGVKNVICTDYDENAVDKLYNHLKHQPDLPVAPVVLNFVCPLGAPTQASYSSRFKSDAVVALAITHHLVLTQNISIDKIFELLSQCTHQYVFVEFMPLGLYDGNGPNPTVPSWYNQDWFKSAFEKHFELIQIEQTEVNRVLFFGRLRSASA